MASLWRNRELEQIIGGPLEDGGITEGGLRRLVDEIPAESDIVDYKQKQSLTIRKGANDGKFSTAQELAKDICGAANSRGGILVYGVQDLEKQPDPEKRMQPFDEGVDGPVHKIIEQVRRDVREHAKPLPRFDVVPVSAAAGGYYLVVVVSPSSAAPHAVTVARGEGKKALYFFLRQPGETSIRSLEEYEVAAMYEGRARRDRTVREHLDEVWADGASNITDTGGGGVWLVVAAVPEMSAAERRLTAQVQAEIAAWADSERFPDSVTGWRPQELASPFPGPGRLIYQQLGEASAGALVPRAVDTYRELYADGRAFAAVKLADPPGTVGRIEIGADGLIDDLQAVTRHALMWLGHRSGQWGAATMKIGIITPGIPTRDPFTTGLVDFSGKQIRRTRAVQRDRLPSAVVSVDLATTATTTGQLAASYSTSLPILQAFGIAEPFWITEAGALVHFNFPLGVGSTRSHVNEWLLANNTTFDMDAR